MNIETYFTSTRTASDTQLENKIIAAVERSIATSNRNRRIAWGSVSLLSLGALVPVIISISGQLAQSGIGYYLSIIFSDAGSLLTVGADVGLAVLESLPITSLVITFGLITLLLLALRKSAQTFTWLSPISKQSVAA